MTDGKQPVLTGVIQSAEKDHKKKILGRITLEGQEGRQKTSMPKTSFS